MYNKKNVIIIVMCVCIMLLAIGYAAFQTVLNINGTASIASTWDVHFTSIVQSEKTGNASEKTAASYAERTATMDVNLDVPGDSITYILTLTNSGNLDAVIESIDAKATGSPAIIYTISGLKNGQKIKVGESIPITIKIEYDKTVTSQPVNTTKKLIIDINVVQDLKQSIPEEDMTVVESTLLSTAILGKNNSNVVNSGDGLYISNATNDGKPTYYYKGNVANNYVDFAGITWRIIRINEDGTIKMKVSGGINSSIEYYFNKNYDSYQYMYYSESDIEDGIKNTVDTWYANTLEENYGSYIAITNFCEAAKIKLSDSYTSGDAITELESNYTPNFKCPLDGNGKQYVSEKAGLITIDEVAMAGIPMGTKLSSTRISYLQESKGRYWTMSSAGYLSNLATAGIYFNSFYYVDDIQYAGATSGYGGIGTGEYQNKYEANPVISLNADVTIQESNGNGVHGSSTNPFVIKTN